MTDRAPTEAGRPARVLVVDDEPFNRDLLEQELASGEVQVSTAADGVQALEMVAASTPDMIFLDLMMPGMDGFKVLETLQAHPEWKAIPVVIVSAASDLANVVSGIEMGAADFLPKPFEPAILKARLNASLESKRLRDLEQHYLRSLERELEIGREIQAGFLPRILPQPPGWIVQAHFQAAHEVAGDFYDVFEVAQDQLGLMLGDVTDKGVGSALYMALYRSLLRVTMLSDSFVEDGKPAACLEPEACLLHGVRLVNRYISRFHENAMFATLFFGILDTRDGTLCYVNAGHHPPYLVGEDGIHGSIERTGPMIGAIPEAVFTVESERLAPGDSLVLYSDGVPDARNPQGEMFGDERLRGAISAPGLDPAARMDGLLAALDAHLDQAPQYDDITLLMVSREA